MSVKTTTINDLPSFMTQANEEAVLEVQQAIAKQFCIKITDSEAKRFTRTMLIMAEDWLRKIECGTDGPQPTSAR